MAIDGGNVSRALILAGGAAQRLQPLSAERPKALFPIGPTCLLALQLHWLRTAGVREVLLAPGPSPCAIQDAVGNGDRYGLTVRYFDEPERLGSGGVLRQATRDWAEPFWVLNGDVLIDLDLAAMAARHDASGAWASIALHEADDVRAFGVVALGPGLAITDFVEKPSAAEAPSRRVNAGVWRLSPEAVTLLPVATTGSVERDLFPALCRSGRHVQGFEAGSYWEDTGTPARYRKVTNDLLYGRLPRRLAQKGWDGRYAHPTALIDPRAHLEPPYAIGAGSRIGPGAIIADAILWDDVTIEAGAHVRRSILASGTIVRERSYLADMVSGPHAVLGRSPPASAPSEINAYH